MPRDVSVGPVVAIEDHVRTLEVQRESRRGRTESPLPRFAPLPDEAVRQVDVDRVVLTCHRVLERIAVSLAHAFDAESTLAAAAFDRDWRLHETGHLECRPEQYPGHAAELTREDPAQPVDLPVR